MLEKYGKLDWEVDLCDPDFIDELQAKWAAEAVVKAQEKGWISDGHLGL